MPPKHLLLLTFTLLALLAGARSARAVGDKDGNGVNDVWEYHYFKRTLTRGEAAADFAGDGFSNQTKSLLGLDPYDPNGSLRLRGSLAYANGSATLSFPSVPGVVYQPQASADLTQGFVNFGPVVIGTGGTVQVIASVPAKSQFFMRLTAGPASLQPDFDKDGITDYEEFLLGTNPKVKDTDGDGLSDLEEFQLMQMGIAVDPTKAYTVPGVLDGTGDFDGDGVNDLTELRAGTSPSNPASFPANDPSLDTDGNGLPDAWEMKYFGKLGNDPDADPDGDGLTNLQEYKLSTYGIASDPTKPKTDGIHLDGQADHDGDGVLDVWELEDGTNPNDANSFDYDTNYVTLVGRLEHQGAWGDVSDPTSQFGDVTLRATAVGFETAQVGPGTLGHSQGVVNEVTGLYTIDDYNYQALRAQRFRKGVTYNVQIAASSGYVNVPFVSGRYYSRNGVDGNKFYTFTVAGRQAYVPDTNLGDPVAADPAISPNPDVNNTCFTFKTTGGVSGPAGEAATYSQGTLRLTPGGLVADRNHDRHITALDRQLGRTSLSPGVPKPYYFWINDDDDSGDTGGTDIPGTGVNNNPNASTISGTRDLIDYFPVWLDLKDLLNLLPPDRYDYRVSQGDNVIRFTTTDLKPDGASSENSGAYLANLPVAQSLASAITIMPVLGSAGYVLPTAFLTGIRDAGKGIILVEGIAATQKPLTLTIYPTGSTATKVAQLALPLSIDGVEKMYRSINLLSSVGQYGGRQTDLQPPPNLPDSETSKKSFFLVHGYNVNPDQARGWNAEIFKRLWWSGSKARYFGVTWYGSQTQIPPGVPGAGGVTINYQANVQNAFATAHDLASFFNHFAHVTVAAHSLGNMLVSSALSDWGGRVSNYFLVDAAVARQAYDGTLTQNDLMVPPYISSPRSWLDYDHRLWSSEWYTLPWPSGDWRAQLTWRNRLAGVTNAYNFYSSGEEVLRDPQPNSNATLPLGAEDVWAAQEKRKGFGVTGQVLTSTYGGWQFSNDPLYGTLSVDPFTGAAMYQPKTQAELGPVTADFLEQLKVKPFFNRGYNPVYNNIVPGAPSDIINLYGSNGSDYASPSRNRNRLLAEMVPATSTAAGSSSVAAFDAGIVSHNFDMDSSFKTDPAQWPVRSKDLKQRWLHGDVREVSYPLEYMLFDKFVNLGTLKQ